MFGSIGPKPGEALLARYTETFDRSFQDTKSVMVDKASTYGWLHTLHSAAMRDAIVHTRQRYGLSQPAIDSLALELEPTMVGVAGSRLGWTHEQAVQVIELVRQKGRQEEQHRVALAEWWGAHHALIDRATAVKDVGDLELHRRLLREFESATPPKRE